MPELTLANTRPAGLICGKAGQFVFPGVSYTSLEVGGTYHCGGPNEASHEFKIIIFHFIRITVAPPGGGLGSVRSRIISAFGLIFRSTADGRSYCMDFGEIPIESIGDEV